LKRAKSLIATKAIADTDYDAAVANFKVAEANVDVDQAAIKQAEASMQLSQTNLGYTVISRRSKASSSIAA